MLHVTTLDHQGCIESCVMQFVSMSSEDFESSFTNSGPVPVSAPESVLGLTALMVLQAMETVVTGQRRWGWCMQSPCCPRKLGIVSADTCSFCLTSCGQGSQHLCIASEASLAPMPCKGSRLWRYCRHVHIAHLEPSFPPAGTCTISTVFKLLGAMHAGPQTARFDHHI